MQRYFASFVNHEVTLSNEDINHLHVLRTKKDEHIEVVIDGTLYECVVSSLSPLKIDIVFKLDNDSELPIDITLFFSLSKGDKNEFVIQKAVELGVKKVVLLSTSRSVMKIKNEDMKKKMDRYNKIAKEAAIQSHRLFIPSIEGVYELDKIPLSLLGEKSYVAYEKEAGRTDKTFNGINKYKSISVFVGPEGGYEEEEIKYLNNLGVESISLGKRILRCETSAIYVLSVLGYLLERL